MQASIAVGLTRSGQKLSEKLSEKLLVSCLRLGPEGESCPSRWRKPFDPIGGDLDSTGLPKRTLHVVVGQLATLKADYKF